MINCNDSTCHCAGQYWLFGNPYPDNAEDYEYGYQYRKRIAEFMNTGHATELKPWDENRIANLINKDSITIHSFQNCDELDVLDSYAKI